MTFRYRLTRLAKRNLQAISDYLVEQANEDVALRVISAVIETIILLSTHPNAGVAVPQFDAKVRKFLSGKYMIYYRAHANRIDILHVFHGKQNQQKAWEGQK